MIPPIELEVMVTRLVGYDPSERRTAAREWLKAALAARLGARPDDLSFDEGPHGKPALVGVDHLAFNFSHSGATAVLAIARGSGLHVGIDVERLDRRVRIDRAARRAFDDGERALAPPDQRGLLTLWVAKEALLKATGDGVSAGLDAVRLEPANAAPDPLGPAPTGVSWQGRWRADGAIAPVLVRTVARADAEVLWAAAAYRVDETGTRRWLAPTTP